MTVPNGPNDMATFPASSQAGLSISANTQLNGIIFNPGANSYSIANSAPLTISGTGITNNSGAPQSFVASNSLTFTNSANLGNLLSFYNSGSISFRNSISAGTATFTDNNNSVTNFYDSSTAGSATFTINSHNSRMNFYNTATAEIGRAHV